MNLPEIASSFDLFFSILGDSFGNGGGCVDGHN